MLRGRAWRRVQVKVEGWSQPAQGCRYPWRGLNSRGRLYGELGGKTLYSKGVMNPLFYALLVLITW